MAADGAFARLAQHRLEPGERFLDLIEVGAVKRKKAQRRIDRRSSFLGCLFVADEIVHGGHVTGALFGISTSVHWAQDPVKPLSAVDDSSV